MYNIRKLNIKNNPQAIVTAISYESPLSLISEIEQELSSLFGSDFFGEVIFDLLCSNGFEWNRFMSMEFEGSALKRSSARIMDESELSPLLIELQSQLFASKPEYLVDTILTSQEIAILMSSASNKSVALYC
ncbi:type II toxin-antitoxin system RnlB family antitoxin [Shewanella pealeana]|uniref:Uncharacterized protein n=1 Tax=Shewanella pealeana (strain ATCC 700345 / ANG-SQ1) TaxID=398579 RepID=A8H217_SHEPA|nr:type II toxin-antitoxin system RnlB family antitoxin [Shewanella pealeana]ABV86604.1 conserved hypothetical protein [Shewanella pealeana ATCC 700345]